MAFMWAFTIFWCGVSLMMMAQAVKASEPWHVLAFLGLFVLIGFGLTAALIIGHYQRRRLAQAAIAVSPKIVQGDSTITLTLQLDRDDLGDRDITFALEAQENDDGWSTQQRQTQVVRLHAATRQASAQFTLPHNARATSASWRWRASARVDRLRYAPVECNVAVRAAANAKEPSAEAITLNNAGVGWPTQISAGRAPSGAHEIESGVWQWQSSSRTTKIIGAVMITFALFWLWNTTSFALPRLGARGDLAFSWSEVAVALFGLPFLLVGLLMLLLGFAILTLKQFATIRRGEFRTTVMALGRTWSTHNLRASDIDFLQAASSLSIGRAVLRYALAARTTSGAVVLPYSAVSTNDLMQQAQWTANVLGIESTRFDPQTLASDTPRFTLASDAATRNRIGRWIAQMMAGATALAIAGFALLFVTALWKT